MEPLKKQDKKSLLKLEAIAPAVYKSLQELKRTGWVMSGVENPESVKEHTEALLLLAEELSALLTEEEKDGLMDMLEVHDWPEAIHGDEVILELQPDDQKSLKDIKFENEKRAMETLTKDLPGGDALMVLWLRHEHSDDPAAVFSRQLDKYQALEKSLE